MRISDWSSDVCSSDLHRSHADRQRRPVHDLNEVVNDYPNRPLIGVGVVVFKGDRVLLIRRGKPPREGQWSLPGGRQRLGERIAATARREMARSEEHTSELQSLMRISYAVFCLKKKKKKNNLNH